MDGESDYIGSGQGIVHGRSRHVDSKVLQGPFLFTNGDLPAIPGYRYFIHSASVVGGNIPANDMTYAFWLGYQAGVIAYFIVCPFIPGVNDARAIAMDLDILLDENTPVLIGAVGTGNFYGGTLTYTVVKDTED